MNLIQHQVLAMLLTLVIVACLVLLISFIRARWPR